jgi:hypothetical protein
MPVKMALVYAWFTSQGSSRVLDVNQLVHTPTWGQSRIVNGIAVSGCEKMSGLDFIRFPYTGVDGVSVIEHLAVSSKCFFPRGSTALVGRGDPCDVPRSNSETPHLVGLLWTIDRPVTATST